MAGDEAVPLHRATLLGREEEELLPVATAQMDLETVVLSEASQTEGQVPHGLTYMWNLKNKKQKQTLRNRTN